ncbi:MAG TPA: hypothetical protein VGL86_03270 [Polyangia bacterium]|jgi:hypothetical protein
MNESGADLISTIAVVSALAVCLAASWYAWSFARTVGGALGGAFRWVMAGVLVFAATRVDDVLKVSGTFARLGIDYRHVMWLPHSIAVAAGWILIAFGFYRMARAFDA